MKDKMPFALLRGPRIIAVFEIAKGLIVLLAGFGMLALINRDAQAMGEEVVRRLHINPAHHYPKVFLEAAGDISDARLWFLAAAALVYAGVRFVEAYGLWHGFRWAEWFAVLSGSLYLPVELYELFTGVTPIKLAVLIVNIAIVLYLIRCMRLQQAMHFEGV